MDPLIVNAAITGMVPMRADSPYVPLTPAEIIADAQRCRDAGATIVHVHARLPDGRPTHSKEVYAEIIHGIRDRCPDLLISASCSGRVDPRLEPRSEVLELNPDFGSLTLGSLNFPTGASINAPDVIAGLASIMKTRGIRPELEIFDVGMAELIEYLARKGFIEFPCYANILLGSRGTLGATPENLLHIVRALPRDTVWSATGIGRFQLRVQSWAVVMGGHVRVGLEDALYHDWETKRLATNVELIDRIVQVAQAIGRPIATPTEAREILSLPASQLAAGFPAAA